MPWCGKTTLWKALAKKIGYTFIDFDDDILQPQHWKTVWELVGQLSDSQFIELEEESAINLDLQNSILSTSGSLPYSNKAMRHLKSIGKIIYINVDVSEIEKRFEIMKTDRIIGLSNSSFQKLFFSREKLYTRHADIIFCYSWNNIEEISNNLIQELWK